VLHHRRGRRTPGQPNGEIVAEPEDGVVPAFANLRELQVREIRVLFEQE
jgi:hypothetical protein